MNLKANYIEIDNLSSFLNGKTEEINNKLAEIKTLFNSIEECWTGGDSKEFILNSTNFIFNLKVDIAELKNISELLRHISIKYKYQDKDFQTEMKKERLYDEK